MIIKFVLKYSGDLLERFFIRVAKEMNLPIGIKKENEYLYVYVKGSEEEIEQYSSKLAHELPMSVFLNSLNAEVTEEFSEFLPNEFPKRNLPPCPRCLSEVKDVNNKNYYNPMHHCEICGYQLNEELKIDNEKLNDKNERKKYFEEIAEKLKKDGEVSVGTFNGKYKLTTNLENVDAILAVDLSAVANYFMSFDGDAKALASIEKPFIKLKTNIDFKKTFGLSTPAYYVKLPDDMILELLCEEIKNDIKLIGLKAVKEAEFFNFNVKNDEEILAVVTDTKEHVIIPVRGDRGLIPKFEKSLGNSAGINDKYAAYSTEEKTVLDLKVNFPEIKAKENPKYLAGFYGVVDMWNLEDKITLGYILYKSDESKILLNSPKFGLVEYISFEFKFNSFEEIFASIAAMNDTGKKLVKNFSEKRNDLFLNAMKANLNTDKKGVYYLWGLIGIVLGFSDNIDEAAEKIMEFSSSAMTKKGPRIDYKMDERNLNPLWAIRTAMSFRLAGVDDYLLSYGVVESFAEFLNNIYETLNKEMVLSGAVLAGDMFEGEFLNKIYTYISKNYPVFVPKALPMSGAIEAYGNAVINSKS
jgi:hypothetical protein